MSDIVGTALSQKPRRRLQRFRNESSFAEQRPEHARRQYVILAVEVISTRGQISRCAAERAIDLNPDRPALRGESLAIWYMQVKCTQQVLALMERLVWTRTDGVGRTRLSVPSNSDTSTGRRPLAL